MARRLGLGLYAVVVGILSATGWRLHVGLLDTLAGFQAVWGLGAWLAGWPHRHRPARGALAGGAFGLLAIAAYYATEAVVDSVHSATSQLGASGRFWVPAAVVGGLLLGAVGTWASAAASGRWVEPAALSHAAMAAALLAESVFVVVARRDFADQQTILAASAVLVLVALALLVRAWRRTGPRALALALLVATAVTPLGAAFFLLVESRFGYVTI